MLEIVFILTYSMFQDSYGDNGGQGSYHSVAPPPGYGSSPSYDTVVIHNLPLDCNLQVLREGFRNCGNIKFVEMKELGIGIIRFGHRIDAQKAISKYN